MATFWAKNASFNFGADHTSELKMKMQSRKRLQLSSVVPSDKHYMHHLQLSAPKLPYKLYEF